MLHTEQHFNYTFNCLPLWLLNNCNAVSNCAIKHAFAYQSPIGTRDDLYKTQLGLKNSILILYSKKKTKMEPKFINKCLPQMLITSVMKAFQFNLCMSCECENMRSSDLFLPIKV